MKRIFLFLATNLAVMVLLGIVMSVLQNVFGVRLGNTGSLLVMAAVFGMGGSFISLAMSKWIAKRATGARVIEHPANQSEAWLVDTVRAQAQKAGIAMPEVAIYESPEINAFATGMSKNSALVAVSTGLLHGMEKREVEAVLGHEISHVANGDMVTLALLQGVLNTFVIFFARIVGRVVDNFLRGNREGGGGGMFYYLIVMVLEIVFGLLATMIVAWFSRYREFRADAGGAALEGKPAMIAALQRLKANRDAPAMLPKQVEAFGISGAVGKLFASHPPLDERIAALNR